MQFIKLNEVIGVKGNGGMPGAGGSCCKENLIIEKNITRIHSRFNIVKKMKIQYLTQNKSVQIKMKYFNQSNLNDQCSIKVLLIQILSRLPCKDLMIAKKFENKLQSK